MNTRIKQLADEAGIHFGRSATLDGNNIARFVTTSDMEKFAELIVQECVSIVNDAERGGSNEVWDNAVKFIRRDLQEHFGVE